MTVLVVIGILIGLLAVGAVLSPFFRGTGGQLQDAAAADSIQQLEARRRSILNRWLEEEGQHSTGMITDREWSLRQIYLSNRYVDVTRRIEWLKAADAETGSAAQGVGA